MHYQLMLTDGHAETQRLTPETKGSAAKGSALQDRGTKTKRRQQRERERERSGDCESERRGHRMAAASTHSMSRARVLPGGPHGDGLSTSERRRERGEIIQSALRLSVSANCLHDRSMHSWTQSGYTPSDKKAEGDTCIKGHTQRPMCVHVGRRGTVEQLSKGKKKEAAYGAQRDQSPSELGFRTHRAAGPD